LYDLDGKVALVTGTSNQKGIGCAIALRLAREGADVVVTDKYRDPATFPIWEKEAGWRGIDSLAEQIESMGRRSLAISADLTNAKEIDELVEKALNKLGKIDILVNNAALTVGVSGYASVLDMTQDAWNKAIAVNMTGNFLVCKAVIKNMIERRTGKIINISSIDGKIGKAKRAAYCSTKFGVLGLTQSLALELAPYGINVNAVCPAGTATWGGRGGQEIYDEMKQGLSETEAMDKVYSQGQQIPLGRPGRPADIANMVAFLASSESDYITGQAINVCGGRMIVR
jgi:NAD(P)-dependent dehydrogenase (short-subunit alcohol dehydrogenase family)